MALIRGQRSSVNLPGDISETPILTASPAS